MKYYLNYSAFNNKIVRHEKKQGSIPQTKG